MINEKIFEILDKAEKSGVSLTQFKKEEILYAEFKEPCLLLILVGGKIKGYLYTSYYLCTPYGVFKLKGYLGGVGQAFKEITGKSVPRGKDAMKKIEALLLQASI